MVPLMGLFLSHFNILPLTGFYSPFASLILITHLHNALEITLSQRRTPHFRSLLHALPFSQHFYFIYISNVRQEENLSLHFFPAKLKEVTSFPNPNPALLYTTLKVYIIIIGSVFIRIHFYSPSVPGMGLDPLKLILLSLLKSYNG